MEKKAKKIVLNQLNEIAIQWLHLTAVFVFKLLHVVGLVVVDDNDSCLFTIFYTEKFQLHIHNSDSSSNSKY